MNYARYKRGAAYWIFYSSDYAELTEHSCSTDYAQILNGRSTCSVFEEGHADFADKADLAFPSTADFQFTDNADFDQFGL